jgi:hypothetical protein
VCSPPAPEGLAERANQASKSSRSLGIEPTEFSATSNRITICCRSPCCPSRSPIPPSRT